MKFDRLKQVCEPEPFFISFSVKYCRIYWARLLSNAYLTPVRRSKPRTIYTAVLYSRLKKKISREFRQKKRYLRDMSGEKTSGGLRTWVIAVGNKNDVWKQAADIAFSIL